MYLVDRIVLLVGMLLAAFANPGITAEGPNLGTEISAADLAAWDISVPPSGDGLPDGSGLASDGETVFSARCANCHGGAGINAPAPDLNLVGGIGSLASDKPQKTVGSYWPYATTLFDYIRRAMPYDQPQSLSAAEVYAVTAYILAQNGIIESTVELNRQSLPTVSMPNREGFVSMWPPAQ